MSKSKLVLCIMVCAVVFISAAVVFATSDKDKDKPVLSILCFAEAYAIDEWVYPLSIWATPSLCITTDDGEVTIPVWKFEKEGVKK